MPKIARKLTDLIGHTPLLALDNLKEHYGYDAEIIAKLEYFNPLGSAKDRVAYAMIEDALADGTINKETVIIEPTSGNTGIGLAFVAAAKGMHLILTMPETMSLERRKIVTALGAEVVLTPAAEGMSGAIRVAEELKGKYGNAMIPQQFSNPSNPAVHKETTAKEIWEDTDGQVDIFVAGVGTGGTVTGTGSGLKEKNPDVKVVAIEPRDSPIISGGKPGPHKLQGIGANFIPDNYDADVVDEVITISTEEAYEAARTAAKTEGLLVGITSGAALHAAVKLAKRPENKGKQIVVLLPDTGERYLSTDLF
ncbi:cysteine synthase A [[Clostridium] polysaccharolyticum]|uniref:cysteine synthase n=1 Tax=[Clostridium] polysaccharolyticum TaxID=29364 RepID=A0A1I0EJ55_9FIRM|nr:cysteine synthase A [[Clostridium] polysaccharolyticum]SET45193.1 cysteine synthase [[Clostridium] polysaccharolyticum]